MNAKINAPDYEHLMTVCAEKAATRAGFTKTNPMVGAAVVKDGRVISFGVHEVFGGPHAEVNAINEAGEAAHGADLLVTLEPCSTFGKTPPCVDKIISSGIKNVFVGVIDPNPVHAGRGIRRLIDAGINVQAGIAAERCSLLIEDFIKSQLTSKPYVTIKIAMSADGKIATHTRDSKWITSEESRSEVHKMRGCSGAVLTGIGTVLADDPLFTDRNQGAERQPIRVVLDSEARLPLSSNLIKSAADVPIIVYVSECVTTEKKHKLEEAGAQVILAPTEMGKLDLNFILKSLYKNNVMTVMVEAGSAVLGSLCDAGEADALELFIAPKIIGGSGALSPVGGKGVAKVGDAAEFFSVKTNMCGQNIHISAKIKDYSHGVVADTRTFMEGV